MALALLVMDLIASMDLKTAGVSGNAGAFAAKISVQRAAVLQGPFTGHHPSLPVEMQPKRPKGPRDRPW